MFFDEAHNLFCEELIVAAAWAHRKPTARIIIKEYRHHGSFQGAFAPDVLELPLRLEHHLVAAAAKRFLLHGQIGGRVARLQRLERGGLQRSWHARRAEEQRGDEHARSAAEVGKALRGQGFYFDKVNPVNPRTGAEREAKVHS